MKTVIKLQIIRIAIDNCGKYTATMASLCRTHRHLNLTSLAGTVGASCSVYSFYYYYACQAMLEGRSSGE